MLIIFNGNYVHLTFPLIEEISLFTFFLQIDFFKFSDQTIKKLIILTV